MALKDMQSLILGTCISVTLQGRRDPADVIKSRILRWEDWSGLSGGSNATTGLLIRGRLRASEPEVRERCEDVTLLALKTEEGATSQGMQMVLEVGDGQGTYSPVELGEGTQP